MMRAASISLLAMTALGACAAGDAKEPQLPALVDPTTGQTQSFDLRADGQRMLVRVYRRDGARRTVAVEAYGLTGFDGTESDVALAGAEAAGAQVDCTSATMTVAPESAHFVASGEVSAFTRGEAAWIFQAQCG